MSARVALIAGVTGAVGGALAGELANRSDWSVYGLSRTPPRTAIDGVQYIHADMADAAGCRETLSGLAALTHVFYCARATHAEQVLESAEDNLRLLDNVISAAETAAQRLQHVHVVQGGKYYGVHVGPFPTPAREDDTRAPIPNFNYDQQDHVTARAESAGWQWTTSRPNTLLHFSPDIGRNIVSTLGAYAAICRELGAALDFPGHPGAWDSVTQMTTMEVLARGIVWMSETAACANNGFNMTNTDVFRWRTLWPRIAAAFQMPAGSLRPLCLQQVMAERGDLWQQICSRYGLRSTALAQVANWGFADATLERYWDEILSHNKCRRFGYDGWDDSEARMLGLFARYQREGILPR